MVTIFSPIFLFPSFAPLLPLTAHPPPQSQLEETLLVASGEGGNKTKMFPFPSCVSNTLQL